MSGFRPLAAVAVDPIDCDRDRLGDRVRVFRAADGFEARVPERLVERALEIGRRAEPHEWFGLLLGRVCRDAQGPHVVVDAIVVDAEADAGPHHVHTTPASEARARAAARRDYPDLAVIGWIHGHLGHGAAFSDVDVRNQRTWREDHSLGGVVDPWSSPEIALYRGPSCERLAERSSTETASPIETASPTPAAQRASTRAAGRDSRPVRRLGRCDARDLVSAITLATAIVALGTASFAIGRAEPAHRVDTYAIARTVEPPSRCAPRSAPGPRVVAIDASSPDAGVDADAVLDGGVEVEALVVGAGDAVDGGRARRRGRRALTE